MTDDTLRSMAAEVVLAVMRDASTQKIDPRKWWERATTALRAAANAAGSWSQFASRLARHLQIDTYSAEGGAKLGHVAEYLGNPADLRRFFRLCREEAEWIIVEARALRDAMREAQRAEHEGGAS